MKLIIAAMLRRLAAPAMPYQELAQKKNCLACHVDKSRRAPPGQGHGRGTRATRRPSDTL